MSVPPTENPRPHDTSVPPRPDDRPEARSSGRSWGIGDPWAQAAAQQPVQPGQPGQPGATPDLSATLTEMFRWSWAAFSRNVAAFLVPGAVYGVALLVLSVGAYIAWLLVLTSSFDDTSSATLDMTPLIVATSAMVVVIPICSAIGLAWLSGTARATKIIHEGGRPTIGQGFIGSRGVVLTSLAVFVLVFLGTLLLYVPGLILSVLLMYTIPAAMRGAPTGAAMRESYDLVRANPGISIVIMLCLGAVSYVVGLTVVGLVVAQAAYLLLSFAAYELLSRRPLPEPARA